MIRLVLVLLSLVGVLFGALVSPAQAAPLSKPTGVGWTDPTLDRFSTTFAMRPSHIECRTLEEDSLLNDAWGYTYLAWDFAVVTSDLCKAALTRGEGGAPDWEVVLGVLVVVHESYHVRPWSQRGSEGAVECKAIRHVRYAMGMLGYSPETIDRLMPWALAAHWRLAALAPEYFQNGCKVPWPW